MSQSPYYFGFTTLKSETSIEQLPVRGTVPAWLTGTLFRNGPARFEVGDQKYNHWFDGLAMLHKFTFAARRVSYANRYLRSRAYEEAMAKGEDQSWGVCYRSVPVPLSTGRILVLPERDRQQLRQHRPLG